VPPKEAARHSHGVADARRKGRAALYMAVVVPGRSCGRPAGGRRCRQQPHPHCRHLPGWLLAGMSRGPATGKNSSKMLLLQEKFQNRRKTCQNRRKT
jgi:hypothetical protein